MKNQLKLTSIMKEHTLLKRIALLKIVSEFDIHFLIYYFFYI